MASDTNVVVARMAREGHVFIWDATKAHIATAAAPRNSRSSRSALSKVVLVRNKSMTRVPVDVWPRNGERKYVGINSRKSTNCATRAVTIA